MDQRMMRYLIDTNILIYYFADTIPQKEISAVEEIFKTSFNISIITKIEFLGWGKHTKEGYEKARQFMEYAKTIQLNNKIAELSIDLKRNCKIKLPDAVIAATAIYKDLILVTRNIRDFNDVENLEIYNPYQTADRNI
jgi:predicted nucleic acid-binding protein